MLEATALLALWLEAVALAARQQEGLRQVLGWREGTALTIASVLGSGVLYLPALTAQEAGPAAILAWVGMGILIVPLALTLGHLSARIPDAGGIAAFARAAFGPAGGAAAGWLFLGTVPLGAPIAALIGAGYLAAAFHLAHLATIGVAGALLLVALTLNALGVEMSGRAAGAVVALIAALLLAAIVVGFMHLQPGAFQPVMPHGLEPVGLDLALLFWAFVGWEAMANYAEEFSDPERDLRRAMLASIAVIDILYVLLAIVTVGTVAYRGEGSVAALAVMLGQGAGRIGVLATALLALLVTYGTIHAYVGAFVRLVYAQARAGDFPSFFARLHPTTRTPLRAIWSLGLVFLGVLVVEAVHPVGLEGLVAWSSAVFIALYLLALGAALRLLPARGQRLAALFAFVVCLGTLPFLGWGALYPVGLAAVGVGLRAARGDGRDIWRGVRRTG